MPPTIHFVRHAQGYHNLSYANHGLHDPQLTPYGKAQCASLQASFPHLSKVDLVVASPIKRTLYTALLAFRPAIARTHTRVLALAELQETSDLPCDTGSALPALAAELGNLPVDLSRVPEDWASKMDEWAPTASAIEKRCEVVRRWLYSRREKEIVVVTHGGVLHYLTEDWEGVDDARGTAWANCEWRSYEFEEGSKGMMETEASRARRGETGERLGKEEQEALRRRTAIEWLRNGMVKRPAQAVGEGEEREVELEE